MLTIHRQNHNMIHTLWDSGTEFVTQRAQRLTKRSSVTAPPFLPERIAPFQGVKRIIKEDLGNLSGLLLPLREGFEIKINATHSPKRQTFSCAHEIAHTFFFEREGETLIERMNRDNGEKIAQKWQEDLCDMAASELLMPSQIFSGYASRYHYGIHALIPLSRTFETTITPTILKLCDINPKFCYVVHWARAQSSELDDLKLRATWLTWSRKRVIAKTGRFLKPKLSGEFCSVSEAYMSGRPTYSNERIVVGNYCGHCQIWSQGFDSGSYRFVISLIFPECDD